MNDECFVKLMGSARRSPTQVDLTHTPGFCSRLIAAASAVSSRSDAQTRRGFVCVAAAVVERFPGLPAWLCGSAGGKRGEKDAVSMYNFTFLRERSDPADPLNSNGSLL